MGVLLLIAAAIACGVYAGRLMQAIGDQEPLLISSLKLIGVGSVYWLILLLIQNELIMF